MESNFVTSGKAAWYVAVIFIVLAILFSGCSHDNTTGFVVVRITCDNHQSPYCYYSVRGEYVFDMVDTSGKWNIGETLYLTNSIHKCKCN